MAQLPVYDAVNPDNIPTTLDGLPAIRGSVLANPEAEWFDSEQGNAGQAAVAAACRIRLDRGEWSIVYTNHDQFLGMTRALGVQGLGWMAAEVWPEPGVYLWAADLETPPGQRVPWVPFTPIMHQFQWVGLYDLSWPAAGFPARAAGYLDGVHSEWPAPAWDRFVRIPVPVPTPTPTPSPTPSPTPTPIPPLEDDMPETIIIADGKADLHLCASGVFLITDQARIDQLAGRGVHIEKVTPAQHAEYAKAIRGTVTTAPQAAEAPDPNLAAAEAAAEQPAQ